jgi:hypothetical protein
VIGLRLFDQAFELCQVRAWHDRMIAWTPFLAMGALFVKLFDECADR